jgi:ABC-type antimicrobial peptide transport system permease subunit
MTVVLRTTGEPQKGLSLLRARVKELDPGLALFNVKTMEQWLAADEATPRTNALLMSLFAVIALVLAVIGLYGVVSYAVSHRTAEIGIRMALGATKGQVVRLVIWQGLAPVLVGLVGGLGCAVALAQALSTLLYGVAPWDVRVSLGTSAILLSTALMACAVPAMRAAQVDPAAALREE